MLGTCSLKIVQNNLHVIGIFKYDITSAMSQTLFNNTLASEGDCVKSSQGNYEDKLVEELIKIATMIIYPCRHEWRHKEEVQWVKD